MRLSGKEVRTQLANSHPSGVFQAAGSVAGESGIRRLPYVI